MNFRPPKNDAKYQWTNHVQSKMMYYGISESLIKRIIRFPKRKEESVAPGTIGVMQPTSNKKNPQEIWVMYQEIAQRESRNAQGQSPDATRYTLQVTRPKVKIISAWRYPGVSPVGKKIPIPDEILMELESVLAPS